jgi:hypothetical protein
MADSQQFSFLNKTLLFHMQLGEFSRLSFQNQSNSYPGAAWDGIKGEGRAAACSGADGLGGISFYAFRLWAESIRPGYMARAIDARNVPLLRRSHAASPFDTPRSFRVMRS